MSLKQEFEQAIAKFEETTEREGSPEAEKAITEVRALMQSLYEGPSKTEPSYLSWPGDLLEEAEFNFARLAEFLADQESKSDARYSYAKDRYEMIYDRESKHIRAEFAASREKYTNREIEIEAHLRVSELEDLVNQYYGNFKRLKSVVESIQRFILALTHRINELQSQRGYKQ